MKEAYSDVTISYPYDGYLFYKTSMLKASFILWLSFVAKIQSYM